MSEDLEIAKKRLCEKGLTLVIVKDSLILFESKAHGVSGFLEAVDGLRGRMSGASVADKVVGKAVALLCVYAGVRAVYAPTISIKAKKLFEKCGIYCKWDRIVEKILDVSGKEVCPFEKAASNIADPEEAYRKFKGLMRVLN